MRIKEKDKQKADFTTPEGLFEPMVMFFSLTNSLATFQTMMNELLRDLINTEKIQSFIDDVMIGMEIKKKHNELVEERLKKWKKITCMRSADERLEKQSF